MEQEIKIALEALTHRIETIERSLHSASAGPAVSQTKATSVREFMTETNPRSDVQRALVIGYYLEKKTGIAEFTVRDVEEGFRQAKETVPSNLADKLFKNAKAGLIMEGKDKREGMKTWTLTTSGELVVDEMLSKKRASV